MADYQSSHSGPTIDTRVSQVATNTADIAALKSRMNSAEAEIDTKADATSVTAVSSRIGGVEAKIPSAATTSNKLADKAYVDASTSGKASQSDLTNLTNRVTAVEAKIPSNASSSNQLADKSFVNAGLASKQATLQSGTNIKTINGESILGSGNIVAGDPNAVKYVAQSLTDSQKAQARTNIGAASAAEVSQLEAEVDLLVANIKVLYNALGNGAFWGNKPVINWGGEDVPIIRNLTNCTCDNTDDSIKIGRSYYAEITPDSGYILGTVTCSMGGTSVSVVNGVIDIDEVTGPITITASGINLDTIAFDGKSYRTIFETNNFLGISPGFENGSFSPLVSAAGNPEITSEAADSGTYSLKASGTTSQQISTDSSSKKGAWCACRVKVTEYTQGFAGIQFSAADSIGAQAVMDWTTFVFYHYSSSSSVKIFVGSYSSANLTAYIDTPVVVLYESFTSAPSTEQFTELYETYVAIKKAI